MDTVLEVSREGTVLLPREVVERYRLEPGDTLQLIDLGGVFIIVPTTDGPTVTDLAFEIEAARLEAGLSMDELFASLREERRRYVAEKYGASGR